ncbi:MAG: hypothetical protein R3Y23_05895 [Bacillota bacterium]
MAKTFKFDSNEEAVYNGMVKAFNKGAYEKCIKLLQSVLNKDNKRYTETTRYYTDNVKYLVLLARCYTAVGSYNEAGSIYYNIATYSHNDILMLLALMEDDPKIEGHKAMGVIIDYIFSDTAALRPYGKVPASFAEERILNKLMSKLTEYRQKIGYGFHIAKEKIINEDMTKIIKSIETDIDKKYQNSDTTEEIVDSAIEQLIVKYDNSKVSFECAMMYYCNKIDSFNYAASELSKLTCEMYPEATYSFSVRIMKEFRRGNLDVAQQEVDKFISLYKNIDTLYNESTKLLKFYFGRDRRKEACFVTAILYNKFPLHCGFIYNNCVALRLAMRISEFEEALAIGLALYPQSSKLIKLTTCKRLTGKYDIIMCFRGDECLGSTDHKYFYGNYAKNLKMGIQNEIFKDPKYRKEIFNHIETSVCFSYVSNKNFAFENARDIATDIAVCKMTSPELSELRRWSLFEYLIYNAASNINGSLLSDGKLMRVSIMPLFEYDIDYNYNEMREVYTSTQITLQEELYAVSTPLLKNIICQMGVVESNLKDIDYLSVVAIHAYLQRVERPISIETIASRSGLDLVVLQQYCETYKISDLK